MTCHDCNDPASATCVHELGCTICGASTSRIFPTDRRTLLLKASLAMLRKCSAGPYVVSPTETTVHYDGADCDGYCLIEDIENELGEDAELGADD